MVKIGEDTRPSSWKVPDFFNFEINALPRIQKIFSFIQPCFEKIKNFIFGVPANNEIPLLSSIPKPFQGVHKSISLTDIPDGCIKKIAVGGFEYQDQLKRDINNNAMNVYLNEEKISSDVEIIQKVQENRKLSKTSQKLILSLANQMPLIAVDTIVANEYIKSLEQTDPTKGYFPINGAEKSATAPKDKLYCTIGETYSTIQFNKTVILSEILDNGEISREPGKEISYQCIITIPHDDNGDDDWKTADRVCVSYSYTFPKKSM